MIEVAVLWLINENRELLLAQRALDKSADPGVWGPSVTGKLDAGESANGALLRETDEELGLKPGMYLPIEMTTVDYLHPDGRERRFYIYYAVVAGTIDKQIVLQVSEVAAVKWASYSEVSRLMTEELEQLVPSVSEVWPPTFEALKTAGVL